MCNVSGHRVWSGPSHKVASVSNPICGERRQNLVCVVRFGVEGHEKDGELPRSRTMSLGRYSAIQCYARYTRELLVDTDSIS